MTAAVPRPSWREFQAALDAVGFRPSRRLGQNFLCDTNALDLVVRAAEIEHGECVLEVGPGAGVLTRELASRAREVVAVEIDPRLAEITRGFVAPFSNVRVIESDVLDGKHELASEVRAAIGDWTRWQLVANLPYSVASPVMALVARLANPPRRMTVTIQHEVADRVLAEPGGGDYGPLTVRLRLAYDGALIRRLPPECFTPRPKVDSAIVRLELRDDRPNAHEFDPLDALIDALFQQRRKSVAGVLRERIGDRERTERLLAAHRIAGSARPETLGLAEFRNLARDPIWRERSNRT